MSYTWLLFDADDTLFDYPLAEGKALRSTFEHFGQVYRRNTFGSIRSSTGRFGGNSSVVKPLPRNCASNTFRLLFDEISIQLDPPDFSQRYLENLAQASDLFPGATELLLALTGRYHIALVTNGLKEVQRPRLERSAIRSYIEKIFISEEMGVAKPAAGFFEAVFQEIGNPPKNQVLIIGDSLTSDMQGGINFGIDTCWFNPTGKKTDLPVTYTIKTLDQLLEILK